MFFELMIAGQISHTVGESNLIILSRQHQVKYLIYYIFALMTPAFPGYIFFWRVNCLIR